MGEFAEPNPSALIESLRAFGYDLKTSVADLIDNSISAGAENIHIEFSWDGENSVISIFDDGRGMTKTDLINGMRPGSFSPLDLRDKNDLGRFGLGLKTASFSQCRKLTVVSKPPGGRTEARCWDLDHVVSVNKWQLLIPDSYYRPEMSPDLTDYNSGTLIIWENTDRITKGMNTESRRDMDNFHKMIDGVCEHLSMTFHRYMEGPGRLHIFVNRTEIEPWDPFLSKHPATQDITDENWPVMDEIIRIDPYILPHHSKMDSDEHACAAGPRGWNAQQGFYVYRNKRLLVPGSWLNLGFKKEEHYKLARILIDIPNTLDSEWQIDIKKAVARPPPAIKEDLNRIAKHARSRASEIYRHRGKVVSHNTSADFVQMWERISKHGSFFFRINRNHPLVSELLSGDNGSEPDKIKALISIIEETVPVQLIALTNSGNPDSFSSPFEYSDEKEIENNIRILFEVLITGGDEPVKASEKIKLMDGFSGKSELIEKVLDDICDN
ncbi:ATP-binding protein [Methanoplanus endosymbiosus]|uniref:ATP-binding protein n=1 Tax=Methanoplanus endosymbiosus TaxID=33865 RepID=A0A9E7PSV9_9EURY|nr:ATP-binding protein [Methanoplanus endosymbiosus]UUX93187.1 ATP-binding protein [Methanoplanus endosymbiosus]